MAGAYTIVITAVDKATAAFDVINKRVDALNKRIVASQAPFKALGERFATFTKITGLDKIATGFSDVAKSSMETFRSLMRVVEPLAAITGAASIEGLYKLVEGWGQFGNTLLLQSTRAGMSADKLLALQNAARLASVDAGALTTGMTTLNDNLRNAAFGGAPEFINALQAIGVKYDDIKNKSPDEALRILADHFVNIKSPADRALLATKLFGQAGVDMLPLLTKGGNGIAALTDEARKYGRQLSGQSLQDASNFNTAQRRLEIAVEGLAHAIGAELGPALTPMLDQLSTWIATSPDVDNALKLAGIGAQEFAKWVMAIDWHAMVAGIVSIAHEVQGVATALGGWHQVADDLVKFMVGRWLVMMLLPFARIAAALLLEPAQAAAAAIAANTSLATISTVGVMGKLGAMGMLMGKLGLLGAAWEGTNLLDSATAPSGDGIENLLHNMLFDMNPAHWTRTYHAGGGGGDSGGTQSIPGEARKNAADMAKVFKGAGYTDEGAAAMLGSAMGESGDNPDPPHNNEGRGIFQDSPERQAAIADHMKKPFAQLSAAEQAEGAVWELKNNPAFAALNTQLHTSHDLAGLNSGVVAKFEAPADIPGDTDARMPMSRGALRQIQLDALNSLPDGPYKPSGDPVNIPPSAATGAPGATGKVDMNVKVQGAAQVTTRATGDINVETRNVAKDGY
jgi:hypothetical protein